MSGTHRQFRGVVGVAILLLQLSSAADVDADGGGVVMQFTPQGGCFAETTQPLPVPTKCRKGVDSFPCIDTYRRGDARPDLDVRCGWRRPTRTLSGGAAAQPAAASWDGHAELMKRLDAKDTSAAAVEALSKASGELVLCPLSEAAFTQLSAAEQQKVCDRGAAFRALARSLAATAKQGGVAGEKAKALLKRLATDNSKATLSKYVQAQGKFASDALAK